LVILRKILNSDQILNWDLYLNFATHAYNCSIHSSTGFTPFFLTFGSESRSPPELTFGFPLSSNSSSNLRNLQGIREISIFEQFSLLNRIYESVRSNLKTFHRKEKDRYDFGTSQRIFKVGDIVRIRIKTRQNVPMKFKAEWSSPHEIIRIRGVVITVKELSTNREYNTYSDRVSNPILNPLGENQDGRNDPQDSNANPIENPKEPNDGEPPDEEIIVPETRTRSGRVSRPRRDQNFDYSQVSVPIVRSDNSSTFFTFGVFEHFLDSVCSNLCFFRGSTPVQTNNDSLQPVMSASQRRTAAVKELREAGERICAMRTATGKTIIAVMLKANGTVFVYDDANGAFMHDDCSIEEADLTEAFPRPRQFRALTDFEVGLLQNESNLPACAENAHLQWNYGYLQPWRTYIEKRDDVKSFQLLLWVIFLGPNTSVGGEGLNVSFGKLKAAISAAAATPTTLTTTALSSIFQVRFLRAHLTKACLISSSC